MRHKHHIIPRHLGGSEDSKNIAVLTPEEHAEAHWILWCSSRRKQDWLAAVGLEGWATKQDIISKLSKEAGKKGDSVLRSAYGDSYTEIKQKASNKAAKQRYAKAPIYSWIHPIYGVFTGKAVDLCREYNGHYASHLNEVALNGRRKQHKGWKRYAS